MMNPLWLLVAAAGNAALAASAFMWFCREARGKPAVGLAYTASLAALIGLGAVGTGIATVFALALALPPS